MRKLICFIFIFISISSFCREKADSTKFPLKVSGFVSINSNGIAPIPAFSLDKPAIIAGFSLKKNRFSYDPQLSYTLNLKPWIIDNWFHYKMIDKPGFELRTDFDASMFFSEYKTPDTLLWRGVRYATFGFTGILKMSTYSSFSLTVWHDRGIEKGTLIGYYIDLVADRSDIPIGKHLVMAANVQIFYIDYTGKNDGLFISPKLTTTIRKVPFALYFQSIHAIYSNIVPYPGIRWNVGFAYTF